MWALAYHGMYKWWQPAYTRNLLPLLPHHLGLTLGEVSWWETRIAFYFL